MDTTQSDSRHAAPTVTAAIAMERLQQAGLQTDALAGSPPAASVPRLNDAFELLHEQVRLANDEFATLFKMLEPHLPRHLFNSGAHIAPALDSDATRNFEAHPSRGPEFSPTYSKVVNAAEAVNRMRRGIEAIMKHLVV
ncbi:hypothetical protein F4827_001728 [Paraburkholderia bannensis]|uniref:Uncharacterized protein n=1 Tax=Paraburkholderia bannensis TaxID=765414 RepID=A0A7W9WQA0_9BURK|nr:MULTISPECIES: hypothetical protein [Paraburkholderia]MBB3256926.1 hypothetical protein [Paraburkholderia sp. WP4_3_2]MBB6101880.1 hypothetical protein [Paraburkholderia bannensis]